MKYLIILFFATKLLTASMLLGATGYCIEDFYIKKGSFYYLRSDNQNWVKVQDDTTYITTIIPNFIYDSSTKRCNPNHSYILGMQPTEYNFLLGFIGLVFGAVFMFFTTQIFINVGGRK